MVHAIYNSINKVAKIVLFFTIGLLCFILPSINSPLLKDGTQSTKSFFFLFATFANVLFIALSFIGRKTTIKVCFIDKILALWIIYIITNAFFHNAPESLIFLDLFGLIILYFALRLFTGNAMLFFYLFIVVGGLLQTVCGNLQFWGFYASNHNSFKVTGSFFNPGPYSGYIVFTFAIAVGFLLNKSNLSIATYTFGDKNDRLLFQKGKLLYIMIVCVMCIIVISAFLAVLECNSRSSYIGGFLSIGYLIWAKFGITESLKKILKSTSQKATALLLIILLATGISFWLYYMKKESADGRLLIWRVSVEMFNKSKIFGFGFDQFKANYMNYQADFLKKHMSDNYIKVAGDANYAFSEPLQQLLENGLIGFVLIIYILIVLFTVYDKITPFKITNFYQDSTRCYGNRLHTTIAKAGMISVLGFSLFSYPFQILPIKIGLVLCVATLANISRQSHLITYSFTSSSPIAFFRNLAISILLIAGLLRAYFFIKNYYNAYISWESGYRLFQSGANKYSVTQYQKAYPFLDKNGEFLTNYGKALSANGMDSNALLVLNNAVRFYPNTAAYIELGESYKAIHEYDEAEKAYILSSFMNPSRLYPKYLLVKLYQETGQKDKEIRMIKEILSRKQKIETKGSLEIKKDLKKMLLHHQASL